VKTIFKSVPKSFFKPFFKPLLKLCFVFLLTAALSSGSVMAQRGWEVGGWAGASNYFGDLNPSFGFRRTNWAAGVIGRFNFNDRICLKMSGNYGNISGYDSDSKNPFQVERNLSFKSALIDGAAQMEFNFMPYNYFDKNAWFTPYLFLGFNVYNFNPKAQHKGTWYDLRPLGTEGQFRGDEYYTTQLGFVYGGGLKIALTETWSLNLELSMRRLFTDYLDDVSTTYPNPNDVRKLRDEVAVALSDPSLPNAVGEKVSQRGRQRGDGGSKDYYGFLGIGLLYYFGELRCPPLTGR
jgi:opacity protein-like surface antigen